MEAKTCMFAVAPVERKIPEYEKSSLEYCSTVVSKYFENEHNEKLIFEVGQSNRETLVKTGQHCHGMLATVLAAYNRHIPLILSPDDFWLLIALAIGQFLGDDKAMAEKYRYTFVSHAGKKKLSVNVDKYGIVPKCPETNAEGWPGAIEEICQLIKGETQIDVFDFMTRPFSTTGTVEQTVMHATLMETMKNYFDYQCYTLCGIPEITLEGTTEDYKSIIERLEGLIDILPDFEWYLTRVHSHMIKVYESRKGNPDIEWWRRMVVRNPEGSGVPPFSGWISDFMPFVAVGKPNKRPNTDPYDFNNRPAVTLTDFVLDDFRHTQIHYDMKLAAGFVAVGLDEERNALRPAIGWMTFYYKERPIEQQDSVGLVE